MADVGFTIGGDNSEFLAAIKESQAAVAQASAAIKESLKNVTGNVHEVKAEFEGIGEAVDGIKDKFHAAFEFAGKSVISDRQNLKQISRMAEAHINKLRRR